MYHIAQHYSTTHKQQTSHGLTHTNTQADIDIHFQFINRYSDADALHPLLKFPTKKLQKRAMPRLKFDASIPEEYYSEYWKNIGQNILTQQLESKTLLNTNVAKNVIMFLGDGMSIPTITAARVYIGGEEKQFSFEKFPYIGLSKTYCANTQVADSACTATAYLGGVKANYATIGVNAAVELSDCIAQNNTYHHISSIAEWAQEQGLATGLITTTAVTHASPAGLYAHIANRNWENDAEVLKDNGDPDLCPDIATQLIHGKVGKKFKVILGGGRVHFLPHTENDLNGEPGRRLDNKNLIKEWQQEHGSHAYYVQTKEELLHLPHNTDHLLGLFAGNHMPFHLDANKTIIPDLNELVNVALNILERLSNDKGYLLFVEGGRIDHAHHKTLAMKALDETAEFAKAIDYAREHTSIDDTLIVVTSDHSHTMSVAGYSSRKNDIFGINNGQLAADKLPYATLSYANGPGFNYNYLQQNGVMKRKNLVEVEMNHKEYMFPTAIPLASETHGGDDVAVFASGPFAHLFSGTYEQNYIPYAMGYASCIGSNQKTACNAVQLSRKK
ncbi:membrane-bound alkaline phosphatase [Teleopsis dalmanni]|uniref:membrane-bound alkaline phosphatase n=1 Tax=Teleopsis dalmanni TaxID=139649 RepID=UPI0018CFAFE6|nr:membrane-bound alkaline phosphatase [Teleopsis dalmanni]